MENKKIITIYLDTNVFLKLFIEKGEKKVEIVQRLDSFTKEKKIKLAISDWVINETMAVIERKIKENRIDKQEGFHILNKIIYLIEEEFLILYPIKRDHIQSSRAIIQDLKMSNASDALHIITVFLSDCNYFISADYELMNTLKTNSSKLDFIPISFYDKDDIDKLFSEIL
jgi:predicted nucleic acid-binding protein